MKKISINILRGMIKPEMYSAAIVYESNIDNILEYYVKKWNEGLAFSDPNDVKCGFLRQGDSLSEMQSFIQAVHEEIKKDIIHSWMQHLTKSERQTVIPLLQQGDSIIIEQDITVTPAMLTDTLSDFVK